MLLLSILQRCSVSVTGLCHWAIVVTTVAHSSLQRLAHKLSRPIVAYLNELPDFPGVAATWFRVCDGPFGLTPKRQIHA
jgi:hypothetical protein